MKSARGYYTTPRHSHWKMGDSLHWVLWIISLVGKRGRISDGLVVDLVWGRVFYSFNNEGERNGRGKLVWIDEVGV